MSSGQEGLMVKERDTECKGSRFKSPLKVFTIMKNLKVSSLYIDTVEKVHHFLPPLSYYFLWAPPTTVYPEKMHSMEENPSRLPIFVFCID